MNRLAAPPKSQPPWHSLIPTPPISSVGTLLADRRIRPAVETPVATFLPTGYEPGYSYPLVVWLHESGTNERHLPQVMQHISTQNFVAVAPRGPQPATAQRGYQWTQKPDAILESGKAVDDAIELAADRFNVNTGQVFLVGHGAGGSMALRLGMQQPERYAGAATLGGALPRSHRPLRNISTVRQLPLLIASSRDNSAYDESAICRDVRLLHAADCTITVQLYPGKDDLTTCMLEGVNEWIMDRMESRASICR